MENSFWLFSAIEIEIGRYYPATFRLILWWTALAKAPFLNQECLKRLIKTAASVGYFPERNVAIVHAIYGTGMMLTEVATLPILSYLNRDGSVRASSKIPFHCIGVCDFLIQELDLREMTFSIFKSF